MEMIQVETIVDAPLEKVWAYWTEPEHITKWNFASDDWHTPSAENDLREGGTFTSRMEAKDGSMGFDFGGTYTTVRPQELIEYVMSDGRKVQVVFEQTDHGVRMMEAFDPEGLNPHEMQRTGWQAILNNFKTYAESRP